MQNKKRTNVCFINFFIVAQYYREEVKIGPPTANIHGERWRRFSGIGRRYRRWNGFGYLRHIGIHFTYLFFIYILSFIDSREKKSMTVFMQFFRIYMYFYIHLSRSIYYALEIPWRNPVNLGCVRIQYVFVCR